MEAKKFTSLIKNLTGSPVSFQSSEEVLLETILSNLTEINSNQFNELLLLCNKDRISKGFFDLFFRELLGIPESEFPPIDKIEDGIKEFRKYAMLGFGNFRFAYRQLSKLPKDEIKNKKELKTFLKTSEEICEEFKKRRIKIQDIDLISEEDTYLVGYLSGTAIGVDLGSAILIKDALKGYKGLKNALPDFIETYAKKNIDRIGKDYRDNVLWSIPRIIDKYFLFNSIKTKTLKDSLNDFKKFIYTAINELTPLQEKREKILHRAEKNSDIYLTWDCMDVYVATSMREQWEYRTLHRFIHNLFTKVHAKCNLKNLKIRYFDPTQSYEKSRIDKGLIEGLMLKRAKCTIYSVQETDTFGKDSELASTLAQGKSVIAYVPKITDESFAKHFKLIRDESSNSLEFMRDKMRLLSKSFLEPEVQDECLKSQAAKRAKIDNQEKLWQFLINFEQKINEHLNRKVWCSINTPWALDKDFIDGHIKDFNRVCFFITIADKHFYDRRADIFKKHPLGIQMNLATGVANGVLVVRNVKDCAKLLYNILTNRADFELSYNIEQRFWYLEEKGISKCIYRVVTDDLKITNSFWNFYLVEE